MCSIIVYGFTKNGNLVSGTTCSANPPDIIGAEVQVQFDAADVGKTFIARVNLRINDISKGEFNSNQYTVPYVGATAILKIPFTGVATQVGTYTFGYGGAGCSYVYNISNLGSYVCYSCISTRCTTLTVISPPPCITITVEHWTSGGRQIIGFFSSKLDGLYAESSQAWGWGGFGTPTDEEYLQAVAIPLTLDYLGVTWQIIYGRPMLQSDICGQPAKPTPVTYTIQGQSGMTGTVEEITGSGLLWHITYPVVKDVWYGIIGDYPATWVDENGKDQMAVVRSSNNYVYLDKDYSGGIGEIELPLSAVIITDMGTGKTKRVSIRAPSIKVDYATGVTIFRGTEVMFELWSGHPGTKVHWVSQTEGIDWTTSTTDGAGYSYAHYKVDKSAGTYKIYAWDEVRKMTSNVVTINVIAPTPTPTPTPKPTPTPTPTPKPTPTPVPTGSLSCSSTPSGAVIWLDGSNTDRVTPYTLTGLIPGMHTVIFKRYDYYDCIKYPVVVAGTTVSVSCSLLLLPTPTPKPTPTPTPEPTPTPTPKKDTMLCTFSIKNERGDDVTRLYVGSKYAIRVYLYEKTLLGCFDPLKTSLVGKNVQFYLGSVNIASVITTSGGYAAINYVPTTSQIGAGKTLYTTFPGDTQYNITEDAGIRVDVAALDSFEVTVTNIAPQGIQIWGMFKDTVLPCVFGWCAVGYYNEGIRKIDTPVPTSITLIFTPDDRFEVGKEYVFVAVSTVLGIPVPPFFVQEEAFIKMVSGVNKVSIVGYAAPLPWEAWLCGLFGVANVDCVDAVRGLGRDFIYSAESWSLITEGTHLDGSVGVPSSWDYLYMGLDMLPFLGGSIKTVGTAGSKIVGRGTELVAFAAKDSEILKVFDELNLVKRIPGMSDAQIKNLIDLCNSGDIAGIRSYLKSFEVTGYSLADQIALTDNLKTVLKTDDKVVEVAAKAMKISTWSFEHSTALKRYVQFYEDLPVSFIDDIFAKGKVSSKEIIDIVTDIQSADLDKIIYRLRSEGGTPKHVLANYLENISLNKHLTGVGEEDTLGVIVSDLSKAAETAIKDAAPVLFDDTVIGASKVVNNAQPIIEEGLKENVLFDVKTITGDLAGSPSSTWRQKAGLFISTQISKCRNFSRKHPLTSLSIGVMVIWFMIDNIPFYIYMYLKATGQDPSSRSFQAKAKVDIVDKYYWQVKDAEKLNNMTLFCTNLQGMINATNDLEAFVDANADVLKNEKTYDNLVATVALYRDGINLKKAVYSCGLNDVLPASFTAKVVKVIDGDTVDIEYLGKTRSVRLVGANAPEGADKSYLVRRIGCFPDCDEERWTSNKALYDGIFTWMTGACLSLSFTFLTDTSRQYDGYGRVLAVIKKDAEKPINRQLLEKGYATVFFYDNNNQVNITDYLASEKIAKDAKLGIWESACEKGNIKFISDPTAVEVYIDGVYIGDTESKVLRYETCVGSHTYEFKKVGYTGCSGATYLKITHTISVPLEVLCALKSTTTLTPTPTPTPTPIPKGSLTIKALDSVGNPMSGVVVYVDNIDKGSAPVTISNLVVGDHSVRLEKSGYMQCKYCKDAGCTPPQTVVAPCQFTSVVVVDTTTVYEATMLPSATPTPTPTPVPAKAVWYITQAKDSTGTNLSSAKVYIDDVYTGHYTPEDLTFCSGCKCDTVVSCELGSRTCKVTKTGYQDWSKTRTLAAGDDVTDNPVLQKGFSVTINSVPVGASVEIDGGYVGIGRTKVFKGNMIERMMDKLKEANAAKRR